MSGFQFTIFFSLKLNIKCNDGSLYLNKNQAEDSHNEALAIFV